MTNKNIKLHNQRLPQHLLRARESVMAYFRPILNRYGVTEQQWRILRVLEDFGDQEAGVIAERACILPPSLTGILVRMEKAGLIHRQRDHVDSRRLIISISRDGRELIQQISPLAEDCYQQIENHLGQEKLHQLLALLDDLEKLPAPRAG